MSEISDMLTSSCAILRKARVADGSGGFVEHLMPQQAGVPCIANDPALGRLLLDEAQRQRPPVFRIFYFEPDQPLEEHDVIEHGDSRWMVQSTEVQAHAAYRKALCLREESE
jgi:hypothetical protein